MAYDNKKDSLINKLSGGKIGTYQEATGGGTPLAKGEKLEDHPEAHRVMQPRDEEGKFTYNSVNGKELKYGPSRGETIPPFLRGIKLKWANKKGDVIWGPDQKRYVFSEDMTAEEFINALKNYTKEDGFGAALENIVSKKKGKLSKGEKRSQKAGTVGFAYGHKTKGGDNIETFLNTFPEYRAKAKPFVKTNKNKFARKKTTTNVNNNVNSNSVNTNSTNNNSKQNDTTYDTRLFKSKVATDDTRGSKSFKGKLSQMLQNIKNRKKPTINRDLSGVTLSDEDFEDLLKD